MIPLPCEIEPGSLDVESLPLELRQGHFIVHLPQGAFIVDTGAPLTVRAWPALTSTVGGELAGVLGLDHLNGRVFAFDVEAAILRIGQAPAGGRTVELQRGPLGLPLLAFDHHGSPVRAILDTGAQLSYAPAAAVRTGANPERRRDFAPGLAPDLGTFEVETSEVPCTVGLQTFILRHAIAPREISEVLRMLGLPEWIIGSELFLASRALLDLRNYRLHLPDLRQG